MKAIVEPLEEVRDVVPSAAEGSRVFATVNPSAQHVVLVEPRWHGHHATYMRHFSSTLLALGHRVTVLCPRPEDASAWIAARRPDLAGGLRAHPFSRPAPPGAKRWTDREAALNLWKESARAVASRVAEPPDLVFFCGLDDYVHPYVPGAIIDRVFPYRWAGLYINPLEHRGVYRYTGLSRALLVRGWPFRSRRCCGIAVLDDVVQQALARLLAPTPVVVFPDVTDETVPTGTPLSATIRAAAGDRPIVALLGALDRRKGLHQLIKVCERAKHRPWFVVFAGNLNIEGFDSRQLRDILRLCQRHLPNAFVHLGIVPDGNAFNSLVQISDVLYCHYLDHPHSSNVLTKAAMLRRPVLVSDRYFMGECVRRHRLGLAVREGNIWEIQNGLERLLNEPPSDRPDFEGYFARHRAASLREPFEALLTRSTAILHTANVRWQTS